MLSLWQMLVLLVSSLGVGVLGCGLLGCSNETGKRQDEGVSLAVLSGDDDRVEPFELDSAEQRATASGATVALVWAHRLRYGGDQTVELVAPTLAEALGVCVDERFVDQPSAAFCTGVLIADDLVLTAAHCLGADLADARDRCQRTAILFGYSMEENGSASQPTWQNTHACRQVVHYESLGAEQGGRQVGIVQLDRPRSDPTPAVFASSDAVVGDELFIASHGGGLPLKVEASVAVTEVNAPRAYFDAETDTFAGASGAPLFDEQRQLVGYHVRGTRDWDVDGACLRPAKAEPSREQHQLASVALGSLCDAGFADEKLCGTEATCGDGWCRGQEDDESCPGDCSPPRCGDGWCEQAERVACAADCAAFDDVPASWLDDPIYYGGRPPEQTPAGGADAGAAGHSNADAGVAAGIRPVGGCSLPRSGPATNGHGWAVMAWLVARRRRWQTAASVRRVR